MSANRVILFTAPGRVEVCERPMPEPKAGEVLVETACSLISTGTELMVLGGRARPGSVWAEMSRYPYHPGYCSAGEVVAVGPGVEPGWIGRRVVSPESHGAYSTTNLERLRLVPDGVDPEAAAFTPLVQTVMNGVRRSLLTWGESAAVFGLGILGHLALRLCALAGADRVFAVDRAPERLRRVPAGARRYAFDAADGDLAEAVRERNRGRLVDVVFEVTGNPEALAGELALLRPEGRFVILSSPSGASLFDFHDQCSRRSIVIVGVHYTSSPVESASSKRHAELYFDYLTDGRLSVSDMISHRFAWERAPEAYELLRDRREEALGVIVDWSTRGREVRTASWTPREDSSRARKRGKT